MNPYLRKTIPYVLAAASVGCSGKTLEISDVDPPAWINLHGQDYGALDVGKDGDVDILFADDSALGKQTIVELSPEMMKRTEGYSAISTPYAPRILPLSHKLSLLTGNDVHEAYRQRKQQMPQREYRMPSLPRGPSASITDR